MSGRKVDYFVSQQTAPTEEACILVGLDASYVPFILRQGLTQLPASVWVSDEDWSRGYQGTLKYMEALLMECGEAIVNNIIALRGLDPTAERNPATGAPLANPPGSTLIDLYATLQGPTTTPGAALERIALATEATAQATQEGLLSEDGVLLNLLLAAI